jgi:hypothetical protein
MDFLPNNSAVNPEPSFCLDLVKRCFKEIDLLSMLDLSFLKKWLVIATIFLFWQKLGLFFVKYLRFFAVLDKKQFC